MRLIHLSDLHLGKRLNEVSLLDDQRAILAQICEIIRDEAPEAVLIAGDVYDRSNPPAEAMTIFGEFLAQLSALGTRVLVISGNHDSAERVAYGAGFFAPAGVHISPVYDGHIAPVTLRDALGEVDFYLMPFIDPEVVRAMFPDAEIRSVSDAAAAVVAEMGVDPSRRSVLVAHEFVAGGLPSDSERTTVGTLDNVAPEVFGGFDYVALGHLHRAQNVGREIGAMRYCGTPLKYSASEAGDEKSVTVVELGAKGEFDLRVVPLRMPRDVRRLRGLFEELMNAGAAPGQEQDYYYITLTDELDVPNAAARLRERFPNMMSVDYDNARTRMLGRLEGAANVAEKTPMELLCELYAKQHGGAEMRPETAALAERIMREMEGWQA